MPVEPRRVLELFERQLDELTKELRVVLDVTAGTATAAVDEIRLDDVSGGQVDHLYKPVGEVAVDLVHQLLEDVHRCELLL